jgi:hypothetical protein
LISDAISIDNGAGAESPASDITTPFAQRCREEKKLALKNNQ